MEIFEFPPFFRALGKNWVKNFAFLGAFSPFFRDYSLFMHKPVFMRITAHNHTS